MEAEAHRQFLYLGLSHATLQLRRAAILHLALRLVQESGSRQMVLSSFDPIEGRGGELARIDLYSEAKKLHWDLSEPT